MPFTCFTTRRKDYMTSLFQALAKVIMDIYYNSRYLLGAIAILCLGICAFKYVRADNQQEVAKVKNWAIGIIVGMVIYFLAPFVVRTISSTVGTQEMNYTSGQTIQDIMEGNPSPTVSPAAKQ